MFLANESMRLGTQEAQLVCLNFCYRGFATSKAAYSFYFLFFRNYLTNPLTSLDLCQNTILYIYIYIYIDTLYIRGFLSFNWTYMWFKNIIITEW